MIENRKKYSDTDVVLLNALSITGRGSDKSLIGLKTLTFEVLGTATSFTLQIEGKSTSGTTYVLPVSDINNSYNMITSISAKGVFQVDVTGFNSIDANLTTVSGGNVTVQGKAVL